MGAGVARKLEAFFAVDQYSQLLQGKRILDVHFLSNIDTNAGFPLPMDPTIELSLEIRGESQAFSEFYDALVPPNTPAETIQFERRHFGDTNLWFNSTNTPIFGLPNTGFGSAAFGTISSQQNDPRQVQLALRLHF